jgi:DNA-binding Lrp family transcriptional regulator
MDETDLKLMTLLMVDSRTPYRELAKSIGLSVQAVHKRIQALLEVGVIRKFTTHLSASQLGALRVTVSGVSQATAFEDIIEMFRKETSTEIIAISAGNMVSIQALLKDVSKIDQYMDFVKHTAMLKDIFPLGLLSVKQVGKTASGQDLASPLELKSLDYKIIQQLSEDSRLATNTIAQNLGVSTATVARRLGRMIDDHALEFTVDWDIGATPGSTALMFITLKSEVDKEDFRALLTEKFGTGLLMVMTYRNLPNNIFTVAWAPTNFALGKIVDDIRKNQSVLGARSFGLYRLHHFSTWRDKVPAERAKEP